MKTEALTNEHNFVPMATIQTPTFVGRYILGGEYGLKIGFTYKPNWFHRTMMKLCLGWEWIDNTI